MIMIYIIIWLGLASLDPANSDNQEVLYSKVDFSNDSHNFSLSDFSIRLIFNSRKDIVLGYSSNIRQPHDYN